MSFSVLFGKIAFYISATLLGIWLIWKK